MSRDYKTYLNYPFGRAAELHGQAKPIEVETYIVKDDKKPFTLNDLTRVVISAECSQINDDFAAFKGKIIEPPELAGQDAVLSIVWRDLDSVNSILSISA